MIYFLIEQTKTVQTLRLLKVLVATLSTSASSMHKTLRLASQNQHHRIFISNHSSMYRTYRCRAHQYTIWCNSICKTWNKNYQLGQRVISKLRRDFVLKNCYYFNWKWVRNIRQFCDPRMSEKTWHPSWHPSFLQMCSLKFRRIIFALSPPITFFCNRVSDVEHAVELVSNLGNIRKSPTQLPSPHSSHF